MAITCLPSNGFVFLSYKLVLPLKGNILKAAFRLDYILESVTSILIQNFKQNINSDSTFAHATHFYMHRKRYNKALNKHQLPQ